MNFFHRLYYYYFRGVLAALFIVSYPVFYILLRRPGLHRAAHRLRGILCKPLFVLTGIRSQVIWKSRPDFSRTYIIVSNHTSELDIFHLLKELPLYYGFLGKAELTDNMALRMFFGATDIEVDRQSGERSALAYRKSVEALRSGKSLVIFAEGGIYGDPRKLNEFKDGAFQMAIRNKIPILPMSMPDNWKVLPDEKKIAKPGKIRLILHEAVETAHLKPDEMESLKNSVFNTIAKDLEQ